MFMTSAPRRLPASSNELCVRVEASKNKLMSVRLDDLPVHFRRLIGEVEK
jgi:hypothetical protein